MDQPSSPLQSTAKVVSTTSSAVLLFSFLVLAVVLYCVPQSMGDPDIWWHLRDAQIQWTSHSFLHQDVFSFTAAGSAWMNHEWLAEVPFFIGFRLFGTTGLYLVTLFTIGLIFLGVLYLSYQRSGSLPASAFATIVGVLLSTVSFGPRTLLYGWVLLVAELILLQRSRAHPRALWLLPPLFLLWVNAHGSWLIGIVLLVLFDFSALIAFTRGDFENIALPTRELKRLFVVTMASLVALFVNPYGWRLVFYPFDLAFRQKLNIANVEEWKSVDFHTPRGRILMVCLLLLFFTQVLRRRKWNLYEVVLTLVGLYSAFTYSRFLFLASILVMPVLATSLAPFGGAVSYRLTPLLKAGVAVLLLGLIAGRVRTQRWDATQQDARFPGKALPAIAALPPKGRVLNEFLWGGYLIWNTPQIPVFIDSRVDIFEYNRTFKDYLDIVRIKNSLELLDRYRIMYVVYESDSPLAYLLRQSRRWKTTYSDQTTVIFERTAPLDEAR